MGRGERRRRSVATGGRGGAGGRWLRPAGERLWAAGRGEAGPEPRRARGRGGDRGHGAAEPEGIGGGARGRRRPGEVCEGLGEAATPCGARPGAGGRGPGTGWGAERGAGGAGGGGREGPAAGGETPEPPAPWSGPRRFLLLRRLLEPSSGPGARPRVPRCRPARTALQRPRCGPAALSPSTPAPAGCPRRGGILWGRGARRSVRCSAGAVGAALEVRIVSSHLGARLSASPSCVEQLHNGSCYRAGGGGDGRTTACGWGRREQRAAAARHRFQELREG